MSGGPVTRLGEVGVTFGGLTGKTKRDFGHGNGRFVTFVEVMSEARLRGRALEPVNTGKRERQNEVRRGDVLFNGSSETPEEVALAAVVDFEVPRRVYLNSFCFGYRITRPDAIDPTFLAYYFRSGVGRGLVSALAQGATRYNISKTKLMELPLPLPHIAEQRAIAEALTKCDDLIGSLELLIAKKREIKKVSMQELLTGRSRLPGYSRSWSEVAVSELLEFKNGLNKASQYFGHGTPIVNFLDVMRAPVITADRVKGLVSLTRDEIARFSARRGDMFFTRTSESVDEIGTAAVLVDDIPNAVFSGFVLRGRPIAPVNTTFLAYQFQLPSIRRQVIATASYTTRALTNGGSLGRVKVLVPSSEEQAAIASVVADADAELAALERRLESARAIKTGMMQELLTNRTRLAVKEPVS